jgi:hypothetical protein
MSDYDNGMERAQRSYDMQSDDREEDLEIDQEEIDNQYEDIDSIEKLFIRAGKLRI